MADVRISCGFQAINFNLERNSSKKKAEKLVESNHVGNVTELKSKHGNFITGSVIRQTSVSLQPYNVKIELTDDRQVSTAYCPCAAGESGRCKHICAVIHYCNTECTRSKTDESQVWGKPSIRTAGKAKYAKGKTAMELYPKKKKYYVGQAEETDSLPLFSESMGACPFKEILQLQQNIGESPQLCEDAQNSTPPVKDKLHSVLEIIFQKQVCNSHSNNVVTYEHLDKFYSEKIVLDSKNCLRVALETVTQSKSESWFTQRAMRISASTKAHTVLHSRNFLNTAKKFCIQKIVNHKNLVYGRKKENVAIREYCGITGETVVSCGVIIKSDQPWLCASPDGLVIQNGVATKVLEVKCPISCEKTPIFEPPDKVNVSYLKISDDCRLMLVKSHAYYTQCQILMYCTGLPEVDLFIYSPLGSQLLKIAEDPLFLSENILKLEQFYFKYFLKELYKNKF